MMVLAAVVLACMTALAQDRFARLQEALEAAVPDHPGLDENVALSVNGVSLQEFVRALGMNHKLNVTIDPKAQGQVVNNFSDARVADVLLYLCKNYDLDIELLGSIISLKPYAPPPEPVIAPAPRRPGIVLLPDSLLDIDLKRDRLDSVAMALTSTTGRNVVMAPGLEDRRISLYLKHTPLDRAMENLAFSNGLSATQRKDGTYLLEAVVSEVKQAGRNDRSTGRTDAPSEGALELSSDEHGLLSVKADAMNAADLLQQASRAVNREFMLRDKPEHKVTIELKSVDYITFLEQVLAGTDFTHEDVGGVQVIGKRDAEGLRSSELVRLENRTITDVTAAIPDGLKKDVVIQEFKELNGLVLSGSKPRIAEIKSFLRQIDQLVPVVNIEVMIVDVKRSRSVTTGISAGVGGKNQPTSSGGTLLPDANYNLTSTTINDIINTFNGFGVFNLGNVTPEFYMNIQALETDGTLKLRSTPQLSTLNGHEATLSIGQTEYYLEIRNDIIGTQNPTVSTSQTYKPVKADLGLKIMPIVSSDDMVTLDIEVNQSDFTARISNTAPPGSVERKFKSIVRVKNREMIALGGLEEKEVNRSGRGLPLIARIPVLKWIFGSRTASNSRGKLTIFIRPTVIY